MDKEKVYELIEKSNRLPILPQYFSEILELLKNPVDLDVDILVNKVTQSEQLNSIMLKNINTGYFELNKKVENIREAILYLGMQTVENLLIFFMTSQLFSKSRDEVHRTFDKYKYWKHVLGTSVAAFMLASRTNIKLDHSKLFSYGLIHDIGISVIDTCLPDLMDEIDNKIKNGCHHIVAEKIVLGGVTHGDIGAWLCKKWNIREDIMDIIEFHHTPLLSNKPSLDLQLIYVADSISTDYYEKLLGVNSNLVISTKIIDSLGLTGTDIKHISENLSSEVTKYNHYFIW